MAKEVERLPMPEKLEPKQTTRSLMVSVRNYFYPLYNAANSHFKVLLACVGNKDAYTGNRMFDRKEAIDMIKDAAKDAKDTATAKALPGDIYRCVVKVLNDHNVNLKERRREYERLTHTHRGDNFTASPAE